MREIRAQHRGRHVRGVLRRAARAARARRSRQPAGAAAARQARQATTARRVRGRIASRAGLREHPARRRRARSCTRSTQPDVEARARLRRAVAPRSQRALAGDAAARRLGRRPRRGAQRDGARARARRAPGARAGRARQLRARPRRASARARAPQAVRAPAASPRRTSLVDARARSSATASRWRLVRGRLPRRVRAARPRPTSSSTTRSRRRSTRPMWSLADVPRSCYAHLARPAELFTYSASTAVRIVAARGRLPRRARRRSGPKEETTIALKPRRPGSIAPRAARSRAGSSAPRPLVRALRGGHPGGPARGGRGRGAEPPPVLLSRAALLITYSRSMRSSRSAAASIWIPGAAPQARLTVGMQAAHRPQVRVGDVALRHTISSHSGSSILSCTARPPSRGRTASRAGSPSSTDRPWSRGAARRA